PCVAAIIGELKTTGAACTAIAMQDGGAGAGARHEAAAVCGARAVGWQGQDACVARLRYCEYRSQWGFPSSISTLAIETYSRSEPQSPIIPSFFLTQPAGACLQAGSHHLAITRFHALFYLLSISVAGLGVSLEAIINVFTYVFWTRAYCVGCWCAN